MPDYWADWNITSNNTATTGSGQLWNNWLTYNGTTLSSSTWQGWTAPTSATVRMMTGAAMGDIYTYVPPRALTDEEREAARVREAARRAEYQRISAERAAEVAEAKRIATELLLSLLDERQREEFDRMRRFTVIGADGEEYRIYRNGKSGNVRRLNLEKTHEVEQFCIHDFASLPDEDTYVAQMLLLETDPAAFRRIANASHMRRVA